MLSSVNLTPRDPWSPAVCPLHLGGDWCAGVPCLWAPIISGLPDPSKHHDHCFWLCSGSQHCVSHPCWVSIHLAYLQFYLKKITFVFEDAKVLTWCLSATETEHSIDHCRLRSFKTFTSISHTCESFHHVREWERILRYTHQIEFSSLPTPQSMKGKLSYVE